MSVTSESLHYQQHMLERKQNPFAQFTEKLAAMRQRRKRFKELTSSRDKVLGDRKLQMSRAIQESQPPVGSKAPIPSNYPPELHPVTGTADMLIMHAWTPGNSMDYALNKILFAGGELSLRHIPSGERGKIRRLTMAYNGALQKQDSEQFINPYARIEQRNVHGKTENVIVIPPLQVAAAILNEKTKGRTFTSSLAVYTSR